MINTVPLTYQAPMEPKQMHKKATDNDMIVTTRGQRVNYKIDYRYSKHYTKTESKSLSPLPPRSSNRRKSLKRERLIMHKIRF